MGWTKKIKLLIYCKRDNKNDIRQNETSFIKKNWDKKNLLVVGQKGEGKTTIIRQAINGLFLKSIDIKKVVDDRSLYSCLTLKGKIHLLHENFFRNLGKIFLTILTISITLFSALIQIKKDLNFQILYASIPLISLFIIVILFKVVFFFSKYISIKIIHINEFNFIIKKNKEEGTYYLWKILNIYKNNKIILESDDEYLEDIIYKFDFKKILISRTTDSILLINSLLDIPNSKFDLYDERIFENFKKDISSNQDLLKSLNCEFTYRDNKKILSDFKDLYIFLEGEINLIDYYLLIFFEKNYKELYDYVSLMSNYEKIFICDDENKIKSVFKEKVEKGIKNLIIKNYLENMISNNSNVVFNKSYKVTYSFFEKQYMQAYLYNYNYSYLGKKILKYFVSKPLIFLREICIKRISDHNYFRYISDEEIILFYKKIEVAEWIKLFEISLINDAFLNGNYINGIRLKIMETRKDPKTFYNMLPKWLKIYFLSSYIMTLNDDEARTEIDKIKNNFKFENLAKNVFLNSNKISDNETIYNNDDFGYFIIKERNYYACLTLFQSNTKFHLIGGDNSNYHRFFRIPNMLNHKQKSFLVECFDYWNNLSLNSKNRFPIKELNKKSNDWEIISEKELDEYRKK